MEMRLILLYLFRDFTFTLSVEQMMSVNDPTYLGINRATLGPKNVKDFRPPAMNLQLDNPSYGCWVNIIPNISFL